MFRSPATPWLRVSADVAALMLGSCFDDQQGTADSSNCNDWTGASGTNGRVGRSDRVDGTWTNTCGSECATTEAALYCFQAP